MSILLIIEPFWHNNVLLLLRLSFYKFYYYCEIAVSVQHTTASAYITLGL